MSADPFIGAGTWIKARVCPAQRTDLCRQSRGKRQGDTLLQHLHLCGLHPPLLMPPAPGSLKPPHLGLGGVVFPIHRLSLSVPMMRRAHL